MSMTQTTSDLILRDVAIREIVKWRIATGNRQFDKAHNQGLDEAFRAVMNCEAVSGPLMPKENLLTGAQLANRILDDFPETRSLACYLGLRQRIVNEINLAQKT